jgi:hypothetical protein
MPTEDNRTIYQYSSSPPLVWTITDDDGVAIDVSSDEVRLVVYLDNAVVFYLRTSGAGIVVSGDDSNIVTGTFTAIHTANTATNRYDLWHLSTNDRLIATGNMNIEATRKAFGEVED